MVLIRQSKWKFQVEHEIYVWSAWTWKWVPIFFSYVMLHKNGKWFYELTHHSKGIGIRGTMFEVRSSIEWFCTSHWYILIFFMFLKTLKLSWPPSSYLVMLSSLPFASPHTGCPLCLDHFPISSSLYFRSGQFLF